MTKPDNYTEFMGVMLTKEVDTILRLQSLLLGVSRTEMVRELLDEYIAKNELTSESLADRYAEYIYTEWNLRFREKYTFPEFIKKVYVPNIPAELTVKVVTKCEEVAKRASASK